MKNAGSKFEIIFEDNHLLVVNKKAGVLVQGDETGDLPLIELGKEYVKTKYQKPGAVFLGLVHRIDRPVSGIVVMARTSKALERMTAQFRDRETSKTYLAIVRKKPRADSGQLVHWLLKDERKNKTTAYKNETTGALRSELSYKVLDEKDGEYMLEVNPITGRPHQIRVQLASMGCPIKGDVKYGDPSPNSDGSICLHARRLRFIHPVKKEPMELEAPLPKTIFWQSFADQY